MSILRMKKFIMIMIALVLLGLVIIALLFQKDPTELLDEKPLVTASIFPLYDIVRTVGGDVIETELILPPGASPHTFEMNPQTVRRIEQSARVFTIGHGLDDWAAAFAQKQEKVVVVDRGIQLRDSTEEETTNDPHYWLDVRNGKLIAETVAEELISLVPDQRVTIEQNLQTFVAALEELDGSIRSELAQIENKKMITFHDAWYYFADAYGMEIAATFEPLPGREPTPQYLAELSQTIQQTQTRVLYAEPQFSSAALEAFLSDQNVSVVTIDPIGGTVETDSYLDLMRSNALIISQNQ